MLENLDIFDTPLPKLDIGLNIFEQLDPKETEHSMILAEILNPNGKHKFGKQFLECFFDIVINNIGSDNIPFENEIYEVTAEKGGNDILIINSDGSKIIIIENKSNWAEDQPNQLWRYWYERIYSKNKISNTKYKILYLVPNSKKKPDNQTRTAPKHLNVDENIKELPHDKLKIVYYKDEIDSWLDKCLSIAENKPEVYFYLKQYKDFWRLKLSDNSIFFHDTFIGKKEQWYTFLEMTKQIGRIKNNWWEIFFKELNQKIEINENWEYKILQNKYQSCWCIKNEKNKSDFFCLYLWLYDDNKLKLSIGLEEKINISKEECKYISTILEKYKNTLEKVFDINKLERPINREDRKHKYVENCYFDNIKTDDILILTWYAHFEPNILYSAINLKIKNIIENKEMQDLMIEINEYIIKRN